jgi:hypothetical protein
MDKDKQNPPLRPEVVRRVKERMLYLAKRLPPLDPNFKLQPAPPPAPPDHE